MKTKLKENKYPMPDRSNKKPNFIKTEDDEGIDLGWGRGFLSDGRPYWMEYWCMDQASFLTFFMSSKGLEKAGKYDLLDILEMERLVKFKEGSENIIIAKQVDNSGNEMWLLTVAIAYDDECIIEGDGPEIYRYKTTQLNPCPYSPSYIPPPFPFI